MAARARPTTRCEKCFFRDRSGPRLARTLGRGIKRNLSASTVQHGRDTLRWHHRREGRSAALMAFVRDRAVPPLPLPPAWGGTRLGPRSHVRPPAWEKRAAIPGGEREVGVGREAIRPPPAPATLAAVPGDNSLGLGPLGRACGLFSGRLARLPVRARCPSGARWAAVYGNARVLCRLGGSLRLRAGSFRVLSGSQGIPGYPCWPPAMPRGHPTHGTPPRCPTSPTPPSLSLPLGL